jgi:hypothetical protein
MLNKLKNKDAEVPRWQHRAVHSPKCYMGQSPTYSAMEPFLFKALRKPNFTHLFHSSGNAGTGYFTKDFKFKLHPLNFLNYSGFI